MNRDYEKALRSKSTGTRDVERCPRCGHAITYRGFTSVECSTDPQCPNYAMDVYWKPVKSSDDDDTDPYVFAQLPNPSAPVSPATGTHAWACEQYAKGIGVGFNFQYAQGGFALMDPHSLVGCYVGDSVTWELAPGSYAWACEQHAKGIGVGFKLRHAPGGLVRVSPRSSLGVSTGDSATWEIVP